MKRNFAVGDRVCRRDQHEEFGLGVIERVSPDGKIRVHFQARSPGWMWSESGAFLLTDACGVCESVRQKKRRLEREAREAREAAERAVREAAEKRAREAKEREERQAAAERSAREAFDSAREGLRGELTNNFLAGRDSLRDRYRDRLTETQFDDIVTDFVAEWFAPHGGTTQARKNAMPDREQLRAISVGSQDTLLVARAGSGKTATIINRARFLHEHCGVPTDAIMMLAFNRAAAEEMRTRLEEETSAGWKHVMTFHALAWSIVQPKEDVVFDQSDERPRLKRLVQAVIDDALRNSDLAWQLRDLMLMRWRSDWERFNTGGYGLSGPELVVYRRSLQHETIRGEYVKSYGEKAIANFLYEHDLNYTYEAARNWGDRTYRPDFVHYLPGKRGIAVEYFGMAGDPEYDKEAEAKKKFWSKQEGWHLIALYTNDIRQPDFDVRLRERFRELGIQCSRVSDEDLWRKVQQRAHSKFAESVTSFIQRARKRGFSPDALAEMVQAYRSENEVESRFIGVASGLYRDYVERLKATGEDDFDGILARAGERVRSGKTAFARKSGDGDLASLKFVFVDEYQDFAPLYFRLLDAIRAQNPGVRFFCVGDDWQSINGFAGADPTYFRDFETHFPGSRRLYLSNNYRSAPAIVEAGNRLMRHTGAVESRPARQTTGTIMTADLDACLPDHKDDKLSEDQRLALAPLRITTDCFHLESSILSRIGNRQGPVDIAFLCRTRNPSFVSKTRSMGDSGLDVLKKLLQRTLPESLRGGLDVSTAHQYKGRQRKVVVIADALAHRYPLVHPEWIFLQVFGDTLKTVIDEERRLFYVALTRAQDALIILTNRTRPSPFLDDIDVPESLDWHQLAKECDAEAAQSRLLIVKDCDGLKGGTWAIKELFKAESFSYEANFKMWKMPINTAFSLKAYLASCTWRSEAKNIVAAIIDGHDQTLEAYVIHKGKWKPIPGWQLQRDPSAKPE